MYRRRLIQTALLAMAAPAIGAPLRVLHMVGTDDTKVSMFGTWLQLIYDEAFRRLGYRMVYEGYPTARASGLVDSGTVDGEINRVADFGTIHPDLVRCPESHFRMTVGAYGRASARVGPGWRGLAGTGYRVEYRRGMRMGDVELPAVVDGEHLSTVTSAAIGLRKLLAGRTDIYVEVDVVAETVLSKPEFKNGEVRKIATLDEVPLYMFLHKRHANLVPRVAAVLVDMKKEGLVDQYRVRAEKAHRAGKP